MSVAAAFDVLLNLAYLLYLIGFAVRDVLWLRLMIISASAVELTARVWLTDTHVWTDISWCFFYVLVNVYQLVMIIRERGGIRFTEEEKQLHKMVFQNVPLLQFKRLMRVSKRVVYENGHKLVEQGTDVNFLAVMLDGLAKIEVDGRIVSYVRGGNFVGEMSFLTGNKTTADVETLKPCICYIWDKHDLQENINKDPDLRMAMLSVFSGDLLAKLMKHTQAKSDGPI